LHYARTLDTWAAALEAQRTRRSRSSRKRSTTGTEVPGLAAPSCLRRLHQRASSRWKGIVPPHWGLRGLGSVERFQSPDHMASSRRCRLRAGCGNPADTRCERTARRYFRPAPYRPPC
jgi:hypothetical protein